jgi:hypothetical protein
MTAHTIQESSEKLLLAFYLLHKEEGDISGDDVIAFEKDGGWSVSSDNETLLRKLLSVTEDSALQLKNAIGYLEDKGLIRFSMSGLMNGDFDIYDLELTSTGVDIVEGVSGPQTSKVVYQNTFNVKLADNINLESLITAKLGAEFKLF